MIIALVLSLVVSGVILVIGIQNNNENVINLGYSFITGVVTGTLSSLVITSYFRRMYTC